MRNRMFFILLLLFVYGCDKSNVELFTIKNGTNRMVEALFYNSWNKEPFFTANKKGIGVVIEREGSALGAPVTSINAFKADSIVVVFDDSRKEIHFQFKPTGRSLTNGVDYTKNNGNGSFEYTITEENYKNATPCDGPCK